MVISENFDSIKPWLRAAKYQGLKKLAEHKARIYHHDNYSERKLISPVFLIGCGRSGTTILGHILSLHPNIFYLFEPYHLWAAINPITDAINLYHRTHARCFMDESYHDETSQIRFNRLILGVSGCKNINFIVEKTPLNTLRIGYLNALASDAKFIHIIRDGVEVSHSIKRLASINDYKIAGKPKLNQWWGVENYKWRALSKEGSLANYYSKEVEKLDDDYSKGAYEWLVSIEEVEKWRERLGDRLWQITYNQLVLNPQQELSGICRFLGLDIDSTWIKKSIEKITLPQKSKEKTITLPSEMCHAFNDFQDRFGFSHRATPITHI